LQKTLAFKDIDVFDGIRMERQKTVLVDGATISAVASDGKVPEGSEIVDGSGKTLLPGLFDSHVHIEGEASLAQSLVFGVTTVLDMFCERKTAVEMRRFSSDASRQIADLRSAVTLVTAPGGHGTEYGVVIPTISGPEEADSFVDQRLSEGSDYIKIVYDDGASYGRPFPTIDKRTMAAVVKAAHSRGKLAVVHSLSLAFAADSLESGADGLVHLFIDRVPDARFESLFLDRRRFVIPTLTVLESVCGVPGGEALLSETDFGEYLSEDSAKTLSSLPRKPREVSPSYSVPKETVRVLRRLGVPILAGSDAPNPGTTYGASLHRELYLLVQAGLTPEEALASATSVPAKVFGLPDRGRIAPGLRADLLMVRGDPSDRIENTRDIAGIWRLGSRVERKPSHKADPSV
jgi:imidazolonepropionase-like amidohydrolase